LNYVWRHVLFNFRYFYVHNENKMYSSKEMIVWLYVYCKNMDIHCSGRFLPGVDKGFPQAVTRMLGPLLNFWIPIGTPKKKVQDSDFGSNSREPVSGSCWLFKMVTLENRCAGPEQSLLFDQFKAFICLDKEENTYFP